MLCENCASMTKITQTTNKEQFKQINQKNILRKEWIKSSTICGFISTI